ncbi:kazrin-like [Pteropus vampyrus]|uniref:Kazrin-like n=1 Tax=Pteropus vampyrus TaxID=132908 RepID=A0A6P3QKL6_PTEVA|nr:kazrin-like [Pteropus vampyrus]
MPPRAPAAKSKAWSLVLIQVSGASLQRQRNVESGKAVEPTLLLEPPARAWACQLRSDCQKQCPEAHDFGGFAKDEEVAETTRAVAEMTNNFNQSVDTDDIEELLDDIEVAPEEVADEDAVKALAKEKDLLEREKWELRRQAKEATDHATALRSQLDLKDNRMKELEAELAMAKQSLATLTKDVPKRHSLAMPGETVLNGNQEWVVQADLPLTAAIRQSQQTLYHSHPPHPADRQGDCPPGWFLHCGGRAVPKGWPPFTEGPVPHGSPALRCHVSPLFHLSLLLWLQGDSPGPVQKNLHNPIVQSLEDLEDQKRKKKKEKMGFGSISRVFARGKQRKSLDPGLFDGTAPDYYIEEDADW